MVESILYTLSAGFFSLAFDFMLFSFFDDGMADRYRPIVNAVDA